MGSGGNQYKEKNPNWKGGITICERGYRRILNPSHPRANVKGYVNEHLVIAEKVLGKPLPKDTVIHHFNGNTGDNVFSNLVICENQAYHFLLHVRHRAFVGCGNSHYRKCVYCKEWDDPRSMSIAHNYAYHRYCHNKRIRERQK